MSFSDPSWGPPMFPMKHPCPCGSGKKFKHCCVDLVYIDASVVLGVERSSPGHIAGVLAALESPPPESMK